MGQPTVDSDGPVQSSSSSSSATASTATTTTAPPPAQIQSARSLPPAALELAAKLFDLARAGATPALSQYLGAGIPANLTNSTGDTLLMLAAYHGHAETVRMLLGAGADPDAVNARGQSPLAGACFKGYRDVVEALVGGGADKWGGRPSAVETARMFRRADLLVVLGEDPDSIVPLGGQGEGAGTA